MSDDVKAESDTPAKRPPRGSPLRRRKPLGPRNLNGPKGAKITLAQIETAIRATGGILTHAADKLKISRSALYKRVRANKHLQEIVDSVRDVEIDLDESSLRRIRRDPKHKDHFKAVQFYLKTIGRARGYGDKLEISAPPDASIQWVLPKKRSLDEEPESADPTAEPVDDARPEEETADSES